MVRQACPEQLFILREPPDERLVEGLTTNGLHTLEISYSAVHPEPVEGRMANRGKSLGKGEGKSEEIFTVEINSGR